MVADETDKQDDMHEADNRDAAIDEIEEMAQAPAKEHADNCNRVNTSSDVQNPQNDIYDVEVGNIDYIQKDMYNFSENCTRIFTT